MNKKICYVSKDFSNEYRTLYGLKKKQLEKEVERLQKKYWDLKIWFKDEVFLGLTPMFIFPNDFVGLGIDWQFSYILTVQSEGSNLYCDFHVRNKKDINIAIQYFLSNKNKYETFQEEDWYVVSGELYSKEMFRKFCSSFKGFLTNFYAMDNLYGDIARQLVNSKKLSFEESNDFDKVVKYYKRLIAHEDKEKCLTALEQLWKLYS